MQTLTEAKNALNQGIYQMIKDGKTLEQISSTVQLPLLTIKALYKEDVSKYIAQDNLQSAAQHRKAVSGKNGYLPLDYYRDYIVDKSDYLQPSRIIKLYGSWSKALTTAGVMKPEKRWTKEECISAMREYHANEGKVPAPHTWEGPSETRPSYDYLVQTFGDIDNALEAADLPNSKKWRNISEQEIYRHMSVWQHLHIPSRQEWDDIAGSQHPTSSIICSRLNVSWPNAWYMYALKLNSQKTATDKRTGKKEALLEAVKENPGMNITQLAQYTGTGNSYVSVLIKQLVAEGAVKKDDKRRYSVA